MSAKVLVRASATRLLVARRRSPRQWLALLPLALALAACSVKPEPIAVERHVERARADYATLYKDQVPLDGPLTLHEAIARAIKYNFDHRLALMEGALQDSQLGLASMSMLPRLAASAGYTTRSNEPASSSRSVLTGRQSLEPSVSQDMQRWTSDLSFSWNLLDFGLSYFQARQQADRALIAVERRRRVINNMMKEVRSSYWRAATAQRLLPRIDPILAEAEKALAASREIEKSRLEPVLSTLEYQKSLLQVVNQLRRLKSDLSVAKAQLAALLNISPGTPFTLAAAEADMDPPAPLTAEARDLEVVGLASRPELREEAYQERIDRAGIYKEYVRLLPGVSLVTSLNYDSNSFLVNQAWAEAGFRATWNLFGLLSGPKAIEVAETQMEVSKARRLALSVAVLTQINISAQQYARSLEAYDTARQISRIEDRIMKTVTDEGTLDAQPELERIRRSLASIAAELERDRSYTEVQAALANLYISVGIDPIPPSLMDEDLPGLTRTVQAALADLDKGRLPTLPHVPDTQPQEEPRDKTASPTPVS